MKTTLYKSLAFALLTLVTISSYAQVGHSQVISNAEKSHYDNKFFKVDFTANMEDDFDLDGHPDRVICGNTVINKIRRINIRVISGKTNKNLFVWNWGAPQAVIHGGKAKIAVTGCDIVHLRPSRPSIIVSTIYMHDIHGARVMAPQFIMHNVPSKNKLVAKHIKIPGTNSFFRSAARSVKCTQVPYRLIKSGVKNGAYCFYAGYDSQLGFNRGYGSATAFVKYEQGQGDTFIVKDLTTETGLPWSGGMSGTKLNTVRQIRMCNGARKYDGLHMMGGAFVDYNRDGLKDLITVGQHASIRSHQMVFNSKKAEKFTFKTDYINDVNKGGMSEFLRIMSFDENQKYANSSCVYISGEISNGCGSVPDHMRCYKNGKWETSYPEGPKFSSTMAPVVLKASGNGQYIIKATKIANGKHAGVKHMRIGGAHEKKIVMSVSPKVVKQKTSIVVNGWACVLNTRWRPRITISNKSHHREKGYKKYYQAVTSVNSEPMLSKRCLQPNSFPIRFRAVIPKKNLTSQKGKLFIQADFYHSKTINVRHVNRVVNY